MLNVIPAAVSELEAGQSHSEAVEDGRKQDRKTLCQVYFEKYWPTFTFINLQVEHGLYNNK